jgi:hypothetical protein
MGYLLNPTVLSLKTVIPEANVLNLDTTPYNILQPVNNTFLLLKYAALTAANNQTISYGGFQHIYLSGTGSQPPFALYEENSDISSVYLTIFNLGSTHPPSRFGSIAKLGGGLDIAFSNALTQGNGDLILYIEYQYLII